MLSVGNRQGDAAMHYNWKRIRKVMSELFDPYDQTAKMGRATLVWWYTKEQIDPNVLQAFIHLCDVRGEDQFQHAAANWHKATVDFIPIVKQINGILTGELEEIV